MKSLSGTGADIRLKLLRETTTLGVREEKVTRWRLNRETTIVQTPWGDVRVKLAHLPNGELKGSPEFEDCRRLAQEHHVPLREIYLIAMTCATTRNSSLHEK